MYEAHTTLKVPQLKTCLTRTPHRSAAHLVRFAAASMSRLRRTHA